MDTGKWLAGPQEISGNAGASPARPKMFCFPHAGGGASFYRNWERNLRGLADVRAVQLPGREERFREPRYYSIHRLADALFEAEEGRGWFDGACILFGHSMGAKIAFEVARRLVLQGRPPALLLVSGSRPVHMPPRKLLSDLPDEAFDAELRQLAGTPEEILREPDLMRMFRPLLRADFAMDESYVCDACLDVPLCVFSGDADEEVCRQDLEAWREQTRRAFAAHILPGDHFFLKKDEDTFLMLLREELGRMLEQTR